MADIELISNTHLQSTPISCANCSSSEAGGQKQGAKGVFSEHLNESLNQPERGNGEVLPNGGNKLPQPILSQEITGSKTSLQSIGQGPQLDYFDPNLLSDFKVNNLTEILEESSVDNILALESNVNLLSEEKTTVQESSSLTDIVNSLEEVVDLDLQKASEILSQEVEEFSEIPAALSVTASLTNNAAIKIAQTDNLSSIASKVANQQGLSADAQPVELGFQQNIFSNLSPDGSQPTLYSSVQKLEIGGSKDEKLDDFIAKYLTEDNSFKNSFKNKIINVDNFQQNISAIKSEPALQNLSVSTVLDSYGNLSSGHLQPKPIESPIPLLIKQGIASEQVQQEIDQSISQNIKWLLGNKVHNARISVFPESLGQVNIALNLEDSNLKLNFIATSNITRDLIESSVSTLRNHFSESGINLQEVNVETGFSGQAEAGGSFSNLNDQKEDSPNSRSRDGVSNNDLLAMHEAVKISTSLHLLDAYV